MTKKLSPEELKQKAEDTLGRIEKFYGFTPLVNQVLVNDPKTFLPFVELNKNAFFSKGALSIRIRELAAISAAAALASEHCLPIHIEMAQKHGATREEVLEAMIVGSLMSMTRSQSVGFRAWKEAFGEE